MYTARKIIYFDPFYFKNGDPSKPKYFIVLYSDTNNSVLASLPSSIDSVSGCAAIKHGCINIDEANFNCYHFEAHKPIATNDWAFPLPTYVYGQYLYTYDLTLLKDIYQVEGVEYEIIGELTEKEYKALLHCFIKSKTVKRKFKDLLSKLIYL